MLKNNSPEGNYPTRKGVCKLLNMLMRYAPCPTRYAESHKCECYH
jgi:hypothetical protein